MRKYLRKDWKSFDEDAGERKKWSSQTCDKAKGCVKIPSLISFDNNNKHETGDGRDPIAMITLEIWEFTICKPLVIGFTNYESSKLYLKKHNKVCKPNLEKTLYKQMEIEPFETKLETYDLETEL